MDILYLGYVQTLLHETVGLVTILNPVAAVAIMISSSPSGLTKEDAGIIGRKTAITILISSLLTVFFGNLIFELFGINTSSIMSPPHNPNLPKYLTF
jgi:multiple antibiotic resistance protein